jgi:hypothetical protein
VSSGIDAGIGTSDEQGQRILTIHQTFEQTLLGTENTVLELVNAFNELPHAQDLHGSRRRTRNLRKETSGTRLAQCGRDR